MSIVTLYVDENTFILHHTDEYEAVIAPGVTTGELMKQFLAKNVCLESDVILPSVTYGGILTTGCHVCTLIIMYNYNMVYARENR